MNRSEIKNTGLLKKSGYSYRSIRDEIRSNLIHALSENKNVFPEIIGFEETVIPQLHTALLSKHNIIFLGLRGQAKTRIARLMTRLLDEYVPVVEGTELNDDPLNPVSGYAKDRIASLGDETPVEWIHRNERYVEKLATPDVTVADLIGDIDPIKAAAMKLTYADERVIHYGLVPRSNRHIFVINELPDLQPRIQVALFNILQEGDIQIRGFKLRLPLDILFIFTANPEDYTNRGSIVTPLKDRIGSQILTHYPRSVEISSAITRQEAHIPDEQKKNIMVDELMFRLIERVAMEARKSEYVDQKSGVSARLTISALEALYSVCEQRMIKSGSKKTSARISDLYGIIPSITGKVELVYEGEVEGISVVANTLIGKAIRSEFESVYPDPEKAKKAKQLNPYSNIIEWFALGNELDLLHHIADHEFEHALSSCPFPSDFVKKYFKGLDRPQQLLQKEFILHGLAECSQISKKPLESGVRFRDLMSTMLNFSKESEDFSGDE